jgi:hypothetical protein
VPTLSLADLLEVLSEEIATRYSSHAVVWNLVALLVAGVFLIVSCWLLGVLSGKKPTRQLHSEPTKHQHAQLRSANTERERKIKELREKERVREKERARAMSDNNKAPKGEPKGDKGPKNPKSSPASQDIHVLTRKGNLAGVSLYSALFCLLFLPAVLICQVHASTPLFRSSYNLIQLNALSLAPHYFSIIYNKRTLT